MSLPSSTPTFLAPTPTLLAHICPLINSEDSPLPSELLESLRLAVGSTKFDTDTQKWALDRPDRSDVRIPYPLVRKLGIWGKENPEKIQKLGLDPSSYDPILLPFLSHTLMPAGTHVPPPSTASIPTPSPYLPTSYHKQNEAPKSASKDWSKASKEIGAIANVLFSAGGVAGGVWYVGRTTAGWSVEVTTLLSFLSFVFLLIVETVLYFIYFNKLNDSRKQEEKALRKWMKEGRTIVPEEDRKVIEYPGNYPGNEDVKKIDAAPEKVIGNEDKSEGELRRRNRNS